MNGKTSKPQRGEAKASKDEELRQRALDLAASTTTGVLGTLDGEGYPYTSLVELVFDGKENFWLLLSDLAVHTKNVRRDERASVLLHELPAEKESGLASQRATYLGRLIQEEAHEEIRQAYLQQHGHAKNYIEFSDFRFFRLHVQRVRLVAGFGQMGWLRGALG